MALQLSLPWDRGRETPEHGLFSFASAGALLESEFLSLSRLAQYRALMVPAWRESLTSSCFHFTKSRNVDDHKPGL